MSKFSGKCDFYDWFIMLCHDNPDATEFDCFEEFMKLTGGLIYQTFPMKLSSYNIKHELETNEYLEKNEDGSFRYFFQDYSNFKKIKGYRGVFEIHIKTLIDLVQYFPYLIVLYHGSTIFISGDSYVNKAEQEAREYGYQDTMVDHYRETLSNEYRRLVLEESKLKEKSIF